MKSSELRILASSLPVGLLESGAGAATSELLGLTAAGICDKESAVVPDEDVLDLLLGLLVDVLLVKGDQRLGDALTDGIDPGDMTAALDADPHVDPGKTVAAEQENGLVCLVPEDLRLHELDGAAVDLDQPPAALAVSDGHRVLLPPEALHRLDRSGRHCCNMEETVRRKSREPAIAVGVGNSSGGGAAGPLPASAPT